MSLEIGAASLYDEAIKAAAKAAVGAGRLPAPTIELTVDNPLCGDRITLGVNLEEGRIAAVGHRVRGCLLCEAGASLLAQHAPHSDLDRASALAGQLAEFLKHVEAREGAAAPETMSFEAPWEQLKIFAPVGAFKSRHRCVTLPFEALAKILAQTGQG